MSAKKISCLFLFVFYLAVSFAQTHQQRFESIDVQHYSFEIHLNDANDKIEGKTSLQIKFLKPCDQVVLDLVGKDKEQTGMVVEQVTMNEKKLKFVHENSQLKISIDKTANAGDNYEFEIEYAGIPGDGLVISRNKYSDRTFFGDNWPDRAKYWLPTVDHPSDKATLEFKIYAPEHYEVVSNGYLAEKMPLDGDMEFTHWKEDVPLSTKLMVIGVADFAVGNKTKCHEVPVSSWVFAKNKEKGFENYQYGSNALCYYSELIGPYSYEKLAHVQSKTRYGGMENAGCIFYNENSATSDRSQEGLFAHEVAHQWFGNSVTEQNWHHIWLSEGFATYLTHVYFQHFYGENTYKERLKNDRERVIRYSYKNFAPVIDTTITDYTHLLSANSYQKASWFLHMLRQKLGDNTFFEGLHNYYSAFKNSTALTSDFRKVIESVSGEELESFFHQWLWQPGHPVLELSWTQNKNNLIINARQKQPDYLFTFPFEIKVSYNDGTSQLLTLNIQNKINMLTYHSEKEIENVAYDPEVKILFEISEEN